MQLNIVLAQLKIGHDTMEHAFDELQAFFDKNAPTPRSFLILPEMWPSGFNRSKLFHSMSKSKDLLDTLKTFALKYQIYLSVPIPIRVSTQSQKSFNSFVCISPKGTLISEYHKLHLFPLTKESTIFQAGQYPVIVDIEGVKIGFATCYDLRFPEIFRKYAEDGAELVVVSACFPNPRHLDWVTLLRARAIENQYFVAGVNAAATETIDGEELTYFGHSTVISPKGNDYITLDNLPAVEQTKINKSEVYECRSHIHFIKDRTHVFQK